MLNILPIKCKKIATNNAFEMSKNCVYYETPISSTHHTSAHSCRFMTWWWIMPQILDGKFKWSHVCSSSMSKHLLIVRDAMWWLTHSGEAHRSLNECLLNGVFHPEAHRNWRMLAQWIVALWWSASFAKWMLAQRIINLSIICNGDTLVKRIVHRMNACSTDCFATHIILMNACSMDCDTRTQCDD